MLSFAATRCEGKYTGAVARGKGWFKFLIYGTCTRNARQIPDAFSSAGLTFPRRRMQKQYYITVAALFQVSCYLGRYNEPSYGRPYYKRTADQIVI